MLLFRLDQHLEDARMANQTKVRFVTKGQIWFNGNPELQDLEIIKRDGQIMVDGKPMKMEFNGLQLRFSESGSTFGENVCGSLKKMRSRLTGIWIIFDVFFDGSKPPVPIAEMYDVLK